MLVHCISNNCPYIKTCARSLNLDYKDKHQRRTDYTYECMWNDTFDYFIPIISDKEETKGESDA